MKKIKNSIINGFIILVSIVLVALIALLLVDNKNNNDYFFSKNGYVVVLKNNNDSLSSYNVASGAKYSYKNFNNSVKVDSKDNGKLSVKENSIIHYDDKSLLTLKKCVGLDLNTVDSKIIYYYNIPKNMEIQYNDGYNFKTVNGETIKFDDLLIRLDENKFLVNSKDVRLLSNDDIVDLGSFAYIEFEDKIVKVYNKDKIYTVVPDKDMLYFGKNYIELKNKVIYKEGKKYITLSNLVLNKDDNIDVIDDSIEDSGDDATIDKIKDGTSIGDGDVGGNGSSSENNVSSEIQNSSNPNNNNNNQSLIDTSFNVVPKFNVMEMNVGIYKTDVKIEIDDENDYLSSDPVVYVVENSTNQKVYSEKYELGSSVLYFTANDLKPDTEYTLVATGTYEIDEIEYQKNFIAKIFRTDEVGVELSPKYVTYDSISIDVIKDKKSLVDSCKVELYDQFYNLIDFKEVVFEDEKQTFTFDNLEANTEYIVKMTNIISLGIIINDSNIQPLNLKTLKENPIVNKLNYKINKTDNKFEFILEDIYDPDDSIVSYTYEVYDARTISDDEATPIYTVTNNSYKGPVGVSVSSDSECDNKHLCKGVPYTYVLKVLAFDNDKNVEYTYNLNDVMIYDGKSYPKVRFENLYTTWEQINGVIHIDDKDGSINSDKFTVIYKNSLNMYKTLHFTTDTLAIPIDINNLRKNETYTFEIYGSLNLEDENEIVDYAYLGGFSVQTKEPNKFNGIFNKITDLEKAFNIQFQLSDYEVDASFEASTLNEVTFNLYQGENTSGKLISYRKILDLNVDDPYTSTIKNYLYQNNISFTPEFFGLYDQDLKEEIYTIEISNCLDYTDYKNEIPVVDNVYTFKIDNFVPKLPDNPDDCISITEIINKNAEAYGLTHDNDLDSSTLVGYSLSADYYNSGNNAVSIKYNVYVKNPSTNEYHLLPELSKKVNFNTYDGTVKPVVFELKNGTSDNVFDTDALRRGNEYYFTYTVDIDLDKDGEVDSVYPKMLDENVVLRSINKFAYKQDARFTSFPSISDENSITLKYTCEDVDLAMPEKKLLAFINGSNIPVSSSSIITDSEEFKPVKLNNLQPNSTVFIKSPAVLIKGSDVGYSNLFSQYFEGIVDNSLFTYSLKKTDNYLNVTVKKSDDSDFSYQNDLAGIEITIKPTNKTKLTELGETKITTSDFRIAASRSNSVTFGIASKYFGKYHDLEVELDVNLLTESGRFGFDIPLDNVIYQENNLTSDGLYFIYNKGLKLADTLYGNSYGSSLNFDEKKISFLDINNKNICQFKFDYGKSTLIYDNNYFIAKEIVSYKIENDENVIIIDNVTPSVDFYYSNKTRRIFNETIHSIDIQPLIDTYGLKVKDNLLHIELYKTNDNKSLSEFIRDIEVSLDDNTDDGLFVTIDNLVNTNSYFIKLYCDVYDKDAGIYNKIYLFDVNDFASGVRYFFHPLSKIDIYDLNVSYESTSYSSKMLFLSYKISKLDGIAYIKYEVLKDVNGEWVKSNIKFDNVQAKDLKIGMSEIFDLSQSACKSYPDVCNEVVVGQLFKFKVIAYSNDDVEIGSSSVEYQIKKLADPIIGITRSKTSDNLSFNVTISDISNIIVNGIYSVKFSDSSGRVLFSSDNENINYVNKKFVFSKDKYNLVDGELYSFEVSINVDKLDIKPETVTSIKNIRFGDNVYIGDYNTVYDSGDVIKLLFANSYRIGDIDHIEYSIFSQETGYHIIETCNFELEYEESIDSYIYKLNLPIDDSKFVTKNFYIVSMNFYSNDNLLVDKLEFGFFYNGG